jgi:hypothetical protein
MLWSDFAPAAGKDTPVAPTEKVELFNGKDLEGFTTWLEGHRTEDPDNIFAVEQGEIRIAEGHNGYLATEQAYRDYHLVAEYKWGRKSQQDKYVRNSGILLHAVGADGNAGGRWMTSIEVQLAQGCEGDLIVIRGQDGQGNRVPATITSDTILASDKRTRWKKGGTPVKYSGGQFWWSQHQPGFKELIDTRGHDDVASPLGEWTRVECLCRGDRITVKINGHTVNECYDVRPKAGKILFQTEKHEVYFRKLELHPLMPMTQEAQP